ncbi:MaoC family dehydratase [Acuticoccus sp. MNP-M23]|uniref:MaoC family dehydratase n=1 Tax=Acuticoccus sp. MNP-M23 TaxID=3072793 RepID=UPI00281567CE|nr:MaoC family dehydratase [Acuticoccus sp. MNP-M23]WMS42937.1 MaoC family dehydratase [Acuticoccus sp. MNP-M23]
MAEMKSCEMKKHTAPQIGETISFRKTMTVAEQAMYTGISGNLGGLYVDRTCAKLEGLEDAAVFELAATALVTTCLARAGGARRRISALSTEFLHPITVGQTVQACAKVVETGDTLKFELSLCVKDVKVMRGTAVMVPAMES